MISRSYSPSEVFHILRRRRWLLLIPLALGVAATPIVARYAPERFRSDALILVIPQRVPDSYVKPTISESVQDRLPAITDQILSRSRLERIIDEMGLYKALRAREVMEDVVQTMRGDITTSADNTKDTNSFTVSYVGDSPETARKVTERLASLYIEQNLQDRESQAENTSQFLDTQLAEAKRRLIEQEKKLEEYRRTHSGELPTQLQGNLQAIQNANVQLQALNEATNRALERRLLIERQIADAQSAPIPALPAPVVSNTPETGTAAQQLAAAQARLAALSERLQPTHPQIISLQQTVADLARRAEAEIPVSDKGVPEAPVNPAEVAQKKRIADLQADLVPIDYQLTTNRAEEARLKQLIGSYQSKVDAVPSRESELVELTRDYSTLQTAYVNLLSKREDSPLAENLERRQIGEQFKLLDAASLPAKTDNERRRLTILASGTLGGLVLGLFLVAVLERRDSSFRAEQEVEKTLELPVLAMIPVMDSDRERRSAARRRWTLDALGTVVCLAAGAILIAWRLQLYPGL